MKISKQAIMNKAGWTEKQYKREYAKYSAKVRNLNRLTGSHYDVKNEIYYSLIEPDNATVRAIKEMSSSRKKTTTAMRDVAKDYVENRFKGLIRDNAQIKAEFEKIGTKQLTSTGKMRKYSLRQFNAFAKRYVKKLDKAREKYALAGSDETIEELEKISRNETDTTLYEMNNDEYFDIFE